MRCVFACIWLLLSVSLMATAREALSDDQQYASVGRLVYAGGTELNFYCMGSGSPTVIFDAGWEDWSPAWSSIQPVIAQHTRACTYDRAGNGFSFPGSMPRTSTKIAEELHTALHFANIPGPYLLVGHSFGGYNIRAFAELHMPEVYGAVFVDTESGDVLPPKSQGTLDREIDTEVEELVECRDAVARHRPLPPIPPSEHPPTPDTPCSHQFFRGLPMKEWSPELNALVEQIADTRLALYDAVISEAKEMAADAKWLQKHHKSFESRPIRVLTAETHFQDDQKTPPALHAEHLAVEHDWAPAQHRLLSLSKNARQVFVRGSTHYIQFDKPDVVVDAILDELSKPSYTVGGR